MKFVVIRAKEKNVEEFEADDVHAAAAKLNLGGLDFGSIGNGLHIVVYEFGLLEFRAPYVGLGRCLLSGDVVVYRADDKGNTVDVLPEDLQKVAERTLFFETAEEAERMIEAGVLVRPVQSVNGETIWEWRRQ